MSSQFLLNSVLPWDALVGFRRCLELQLKVSSSVSYCEVFTGVWRFRHPATSGSLSLNAHRGDALCVSLESYALSRSWKQGVRRGLLDLKLAKWGLETP